MFLLAAKNSLSKIGVMHCVKRCKCGDSKGGESQFSKVPTAKPVEIFALVKAFNDDKDSKKVNLSVGAYRTDEGKPWVLPIVRKVEKEIVNDKSLNHEYLPILGNPNFIKLATELVLGKDSIALKEKRTASIQGLSGTGSLRVAAEFCCQKMQKKVAYVSKPTWESHENIFRQGGFKDFRFYTYWNPVQRNICIEGTLSDLAEAPDGSVVILHACAHNPTGSDPTQDEWKQIAEVLKAKKHLPIFDIAYQGFASGNPDNDAFPVRYCVDQRMEMLVSQSFAKNMGLYNERIGNLTAVVNDPKFLPQILSQFTILARINYSNPPAFGSRIVEKILSDECNRKEWMKSIVIMSDRIKKMRKALFDRLNEHKAPGKWDHIVKQIGLFSFTGLSESQCVKLTKEKHIYMLKNGRINICGLTPSNVDYVAKCFAEVIKADGKGSGGGGCN